MTETQQHPVPNTPPENSAPANVDESDAPAMFTTIVMLGSIDLLEWLVPDQSTTRFDRFDATNAREYWLLRTLLDIQKAGTAMTRWQEFAAARKLRPEDGATNYDALALEALIAEQSLWQRRLGESLFRLICFASTNEPAYYEHLLRLTELEQLLYQQIEQRDYFGSESELVRVEVARKTAEAQALAARAPLDRQRMWYVHDNFDRHIQRQRPPLLASAGSLARASLRNARPGEKRALGYCYRHSFSVPSGAIHFSPLPDERPHDHSRFRFGWLMVSFLAMAILTRAQELLGFQPKTKASWAARRSVEHAPKESPFCRHVDNFQSYLASLLHEIFVARPEMLRSKEMIELSVVLSQRNMDDLVQLIAERKINELAYGSFADLAKYFQDRGLRVGSDEEQNEISLAVAVRNISVHNRCVVNERFLRSTKHPRDALGRVFELSFDSVRMNAVLFAKSVTRLDQEAAQKFSLARDALSFDPLRHPLADADPPSEDDLG